jgi:hypothetical protein
MIDRVKIKNKNNRLTFFIQIPSFYMFPIRPLVLCLQLYGAKFSFLLPK